MINKKKIDEMNKVLENLREDELLIKLKTEYECVLKDTRRFNKSNVDIEHSLALQYYSRIIELTKGTITNLENDKLKAIAMPLIRGALEALVDLINIINIDGYKYYLMYQNLDNKIRLSKNEFFQKNFLEENKEYNEEIKKDKSKVRDILKNKYSSIYFYTDKKNNKVKMLLGKEFKFKLAKFEEVYYTVYWLLCSDTHNDISSLSLEYINNNNSYDIKFLNQMNSQEINLILSTSLGILEQSKNEVYKKFNLV